MSSEQQPAKRPVYVHCGNCSHEWAIAFLPLPVDVFCKLCKTLCPMCGSEKIFLGTRAWYAGPRMVSRMRLTEGYLRILRIVAVLLAMYLAIQVFALFWQTIGAIADVLLIFVVAWAIAYLLAPLVERIDMRTPLNRTLSVALVYVGLAVVLVVLTSIVIALVPMRLVNQLESGTSSMVLMFCARRPAGLCRGSAKRL